jgi:hypothetical protein
VLAGARRSQLEGSARVVGGKGVELGLHHRARLRRLRFRHFGSPDAADDQTQTQRNERTAWNQDSVHGDSADVEVFMMP